MTAAALRYDTVPETDRQLSPLPHRIPTRPAFPVIAIHESNHRTAEQREVDIWMSGAKHRTRDAEAFVAWDSTRCTDVRDEEFPAYAEAVERLVILMAVLNKFLKGINGERPTDAAMEAAVALSVAAVLYTTDPEISVDVDGELSFDLRLANGRLVMAELGLNGRVHVGMHDEHDQLAEHRTTRDCRFLLSMIEP